MSLATFPQMDCCFLYGSVPIKRSISGIEELSGIGFCSAWKQEEMDSEIDQGAEVTEEVKVTTR